MGDAGPIGQTLASPRDPGGATEGEVPRVGCQLLLVVLAVLMVAVSYRARRG